MPNFGPGPSRLSEPRTWQHLIRERVSKRLLIRHGRRIRLSQRIRHRLLVSKHQPVTRGSGTS